ncbi:MAG: DNA gyrase subunit A [Nitrospirota bacterium]|nr:DNA gyrase subunit A [Nitrospirota bacterium]
MTMDSRISANIVDEMQTSYIDYAMSVIVGRALPDARDGLKPVHRRVLYAMQDLGLGWNRPYKKSARVVGDVIGKYHPHGESAVYDTVVRLAQDFSMRYPLVDGQGNFGSIDGDSAAAMRYTEVRMQRITEELLGDLDKETVDFAPTYDGSLTEPQVMPAKLPNLLVNGSSGIAVGMATNIPPHNLREVVGALTHLIEHPEADITALMQFIKGPDFPTAGFITGTRGIEDAYRTGRGSVRMRARVAVETNPKNDRQAIIVSELPYQVNKARLIEKIAELVSDKKLEGISDLRDESDRDGMRVVIELKRGEIPEVIINKLYKFTDMQTSFGVNMVALVDGQPVLLDLRRALTCFLDHRREVVIRRTRFELRQAQARAHILEGLKIALDNLDAVIELIRASASPDEARTGLMTRFALSELQAQAILDMRLQRLTGLERQKLMDELAELTRRIAYLKSVLDDSSLLMGIIRDELTDLAERFGDDRRTELVGDVSDISIEDMIKQEEVVITVTHSGYIKRVPVTTYRSQRRGGKGKVAMGIKDEDFVEHLFVAGTHDYLLIFTDRGRVHWIKVWEVPEMGRTARGKAIVNLLLLEDGEQVASVLPVHEFRDDRFVVMATECGVIKKTALSAYSNPRAGGIIAINLDGGDRLMAVRVTDGNQHILMATRKGLSIRFPEADVRPLGRATRGVRGVSLMNKDRLIAMVVVQDTSTILTVTENGFGKRTELTEYRVQGRGGKGIISIRTGGRNGDCVGVLQVDSDGQLMIVAASGKIIRMSVADIKTIGRNTQGVKLIGLEAGDRVVALAPLAEKMTDEAGNDAAADENPDGTLDTAATDDVSDDTAENATGDATEDDSPAGGGLFDGLDD